MPSVLRESPELYRTGFGRKLEALTAAGRHDDVTQRLTGPIVVDRFTGAVWVTGSAQENWLATYRITGDPTTTI